MQSRKHSLCESIVNVAIGYSISLIAQVVIFPMYGLQVSLSENLQIGLAFTLVSIIRSYCVRRWFNGNAANRRAGR